MTIRPLTRIFKLGDTELPDPNPEASPEEVQRIYAATHPQIVNASLKEPVVDGETVTHEFVTKIGTKG